MRKMLPVGILLIAAIVLVVPPVVSQVQTVKVTGGNVQGIAANGIASFKGIPFAAAPVGEMRWKAPQPVVPWTGVRKADAFAPGCMQASMGNMMGGEGKVSEDCLYLNVWTAAKSKDEKLPVMVWIYGGGFSMGSTDTPTYDGTNFAKQGVVLVSVAYRVGPFGFLAHPELSRESDKGSGTYGIQDMIAGLQWVKDNIDQFGGDSSRVTIFGESAGGIAVSMLTASPAAKGLFQRAISESGGSFAPSRFANEAGQNVPTLKMAEKSGKSFLEKLGVGTIQAARALSAEQIQKGLSGGGMFMFWPVADGHILPGDQYELYEAGKFNDTPVLIGTNSDEGGLFVRSGGTSQSFEQQVRSSYGPAADAILAVYPHASDAEAAKSSQDLFRESGFAWHTWAWARLQSQKGKNKAYVYYFDHRAPMSPNGAGHGSEISYVFGNFGGPMGIKPSPEDFKLSNLMRAYWINFAKSGDPNGPGLPEWPAFSEKRQTAMIFDGVSEAKPLPNLDKLKAFEGYYAWRRAEARKNSGASE